MPIQPFAFRELPTIDQGGVTLNFEQLTAGLNPAWVEPVFANGWENFEATTRKAQFTKDLLGFVHLRGVIKKGESGKAAFTLPTGFRPGSAESFLEVSAVNSGALVEVGTTGVVTPTNLLAGSEVKTFVFLDGITFRAEN